MSIGRYERLDDSNDINGIAAKLASNKDLAGDFTALQNLNPFRNEGQTLDVAAAKTKVKEKTASEMRWEKDYNLFNKKLDNMIHKELGGMFSRITKKTQAAAIKEKLLHDLLPKHYENLPYSRDLGKKTS